MFANGAIDPNMPSEAQEEVILRTKVFYFNRYLFAPNQVVLVNCLKSNRPTYYNRSSPKPGETSVLSFRTLFFDDRMPE